MLSELSGRGDYVSRTLCTIAEIDAVAEQWLAVEQSCVSQLSYFQTFSWCRGWVEQFCGPRGPKPHIRTVWQGDQLVAVWPLMIAGGGIGLKRLENLGEPHSQYCNVIIRPDADNDAVMGLLVDGLAKGKWDVAVFRPVPADSRLARALRHLPSIRGYENEASVLDLSRYESTQDYTAQLGKLQKRNRNRRRNHLARLGELSFSMVWPGHPEFAELVRLAATMKRRWLSETSRYSVGFAMAEYETFLSQLDGNADALSGACLSVLRVGGKVVALELGFIQNKHYYAYLGGFDWDLRQLSPGKVQMEMTVGWLIDNGVEAYDLLVNPADYKRSWSNRDIKLRGYALPLTWRGWLYSGAWLPTIRPAIKRVHSMIPDLLRRLATAGQGVVCLFLYV
ncbi:GNAT family N-acetyltransferase [Devosia sp. 2618]|uniref:GNAT family N-acetyltransferase n=1 Tax=Devosia sp. 2618 TaxID=3156454 RepID=UPI00339522D8